MKKLVAILFASILMLGFGACNMTYEDWSTQFSGNIVAVCINEEDVDLQPSENVLWQHRSPLLLQIRKSTFL